MAKQRMYPLPEAIIAGKWEVQQGSPRTDVRNRKLWAVLDNDPAWGAVRAHELAHVAFTPDNARAPRTLPMDTLQAVEDMRVNSLACKAGVSFAAGAPANILQGAALMAAHSLRLSTLLLCAAFDSDDRDVTLNALRNAGVDSRLLDSAYSLCQQARVRMAHGKQGNTYARTLQVAKWLEQQFAAAARDAETAADAEAKKRALPGGKDIPSMAGLNVGRMYLEQPALTASGLHRTIKTTDEGAVLRAPWRLTTDQRVFRTLKVPRNGSVLIDASGSMSLSPEDVRKIVAQCPAGIVAAYAGLAHDAGPLRILGYRGRVAARERDYQFGGGNIIDAPALAWLATQPQPRLWISDGIVTGIGDATNSKITKYCNQLTAARAIQRVPDVQSAVRVLRRRVRG